MNLFNSFIKDEKLEIVDSITNYIYKHPEKVMLDDLTLYNSWSVNTNFIIENYENISYTLSIISKVKDRLINSI